MKAALAVMIKPVGSRCNMACSYCYYKSKDASSGRNVLPVMEKNALEKTIRSLAETGKDVLITWHGGEPTLAGLDFYRKVIRLEKKYCAKGQTMRNSLQTNGLLLNDEWCDLLAEERFDIGLSVDGDEAAHDLYRKDQGGKGTYARVHDAAERLIKRGIKPDLLCTVTEDTASRAREVYRALSDTGAGWVQFIPIVIRQKGRIVPPSVTPESYGRFLLQVFEEWATSDIGRCDIQLIAETAKLLAGGQTALCVMGKRCGEVPVIEKDGSVFLCDHFVDRGHMIGNILEKDLTEILADPAVDAFARIKERLPDECGRCPYLSYCRGGCPKDRIADEKGEGKLYLCGGMKSYFERTLPVLERIMRMSAFGKTPREIMSRIRNDLCTNN